ncbi:hypothetical protein [Actinokineospora sp. HUAS TT18]|uniref:hypothetical protein n=1 Tax=Actinokineospora sp. HUAS TT18 TaxID=3447451 RepID=UPI003F51AC6D
MSRGRNDKLIAFFGEDLNDSNSLRILFEALRPDLGVCKTRSFKKPLTLVKGIDLAKQRARSRTLRKFVASLANHLDVVIAVLHEDADAIEPAHVPISDQILKNYSGLPCLVIAAVPAWEMESWWFLFPKAVAAVNSGWREPSDYVGRDTGKIRNSKEVLKVKTRPAVRRGLQAKVRDYEESDSVKIAQNIVTLGLIDQPAGKSESWDSFVAQAKAVTS